MIDHNGTWLPSVTLGLPAIIFGVLALIFSIVILRLVTNRAEDGAFLFWIVTGVGLIPGLLTLLIVPAFGYWPYHGDYHRLQPISGTVQEIDTRFLALSQYVVVTYDNGTVARCDDSRCATVKQGDSLRLLCTKEHQYGSPLATDGWGCRWGQ